MDKTKELIAIIKPNGNFEIDFDEKRSKSNIQDFGYYEDLLKSFREDKYETLFLLGLEGYDQSLSISFRYLLDSCLLFIKELSRDPAIEFLRENITMEINEAKVEEQIEKAPYMIG